MEGFKDTTRALLGYKTSEEYFKQVLRHDSYCLITATLNNEVVGFVLLVVNLLETIGRGWILNHPQEALLFTLRHPFYIIKRLLYRVKVAVLQKISYGSPSVLSDLKKGSWIDIIAVKKSARHLGVGKLLVAHCIEIAKERGIDYINLTVEGQNSAAIALYKSTGFEETSFSQKEDCYIFSFRS
jgi:ribosomal protein S18 acetylase RimI-like enzyme